MLKVISSQIQWFILRLLALTLPLCQKLVFLFTHRRQSANILPFRRADDKCRNVKKIAKREFFNQLFTRLRLPGLAGVELGCPVIVRSSLSLFPPLLTRRTVLDTNKRLCISKEYLRLVLVKPIGRNIRGRDIYYAFPPPDTDLPVYNHCLWFKHTPVVPSSPSLWLPVSCSCS